MTRKRYPRTIVPVTHHKDNPLNNPVVIIFLIVMIFCFALITMKVDLPKPFDLLPGVVFWVMLILMLLGLAYVGRLLLISWGVLSEGEEIYSETVVTPRRAENPKPATALRMEEELPQFDAYLITRDTVGEEASTWDILNDPVMRKKSLRKLS